VKPLSIAVIGAGHLGKIHTRLLKGIEGYEIEAVVDPNPDVRAAIEKEFQVPTLEDFRLLGEQVEAVVIATPTAVHLESALWALERGLHCFVEKPLVRSSRQASMLLQIAERRQCTLQVGHVERFNPAWQALRPSIVHPLYIESHRASTYTGRSTDIGVVLDLMIHDLDLVLDAIDSPVTDVSACGQPVLGSLEDWAEARLQFENGAVARLYASRVSRLPQRSMRLVTERMTADLDFAKGTAEVIESSEAVANGEFRADKLPEAERKSIQENLFSKWLPHRTVTTNPVNAIELELRDFHGAISQSRPPLVDGHAGQRVLAMAERITDAIQKSGEVQRQAREREQQPDIIPAAHRFGDVRRAS
jgi:predicted dehydrogenase